MCTTVRTAYKAYIYKQSLISKLSCSRELCTAFPNSKVRCCSQAQQSHITKSSFKKRVYNVIPKPRSILSENGRKEYDLLFPTVVQDAIDPYKSTPEVYIYYKKVLTENVADHQQATGALTTAAFQAFASPTDRIPRTYFWPTFLLNDMLDVYGDPSVSGKLGSDIKNEKCTCPICRALEKVNPGQIAKLKRHFRKDDPESTEVVKDIYDGVRLLEEYLEFEDESFDSVNRHIKRMPKDFPHEYFFKIMASVYGRDAK